MQIGDPWNGFFCPILTLMIDSDSEISTNVFDISETQQNGRRFTGFTIKPSILIYQELLLCGSVETKIL